MNWILNGVILSFIFLPRTLAARGGVRLKNLIMILFGYLILTLLAIDTRIFQQIFTPEDFLLLFGEILFLCPSCNVHIFLRVLIPFLVGTTICSLCSCSSLFYIVVLGLPVHWIYYYETRFSVIRPVSIWIVCFHIVYILLRYLYCQYK